MASEFMGAFTIGQTIDRGFRLYKRTLGNVIVLLLLPATLGALPIALIQSSASMASSANPFGAFPFGVAGYFAYLLLVGFVGAYVTVAVIRYMHGITTSEQAAVEGKILALASSRDLFLVVTGLIWYAVGILLTLLLIVPGIYFLNIAALLAMPLVVVERRYFFSGIRRLFVLTKGRWWKTFAINLLTALIVMIPMYAGLAIMGFLVGLGLKGSGTPEEVSSGLGASLNVFGIAGAVIYALFLALASPIWLCVGLVHYNSLRCEKEHSDIDGQLDALDG